MDDSRTFNHAWHKRLVQLWPLPGGCMYVSIRVQETFDLKLLKELRDLGAWPVDNRIF